MKKKESKKCPKQKLKIVFLGDKGVGKSSVINKFAHNKFELNCPATVGLDFLNKLYKYNELKYKLELWDTAGQEKYRSLIKGYLRGANACVFVYDRSNPKTYSSLIEWMKAFQEVSKNEKTFGIIFGNKMDLEQPNCQFEIVKRQANRLYPVLKDMMELKGSAKTGENINQIFQQILENFEQNSPLPLLKFLTEKSIGDNLVKTFKQNAKSSQYSNCCQV